MEQVKNAQLLTEPEFAKVVGLAPVTIRKKRAEGEIPFYRFGRSIRYSWEMVNDYIEKHKRTADEKFK